MVNPKIEQINKMLDKNLGEIIYMDFLISLIQNDETIQENKDNIDNIEMIDNIIYTLSEINRLSILRIGEFENIKEQINKEGENNHE